MPSGPGWANYVFKGMERGFARIGYATGAARNIMGTPAGASQAAKYARLVRRGQYVSGAAVGIVGAGVIGRSVGARGLNRRSSGSMGTPTSQDPYSYGPPMI